MYMIKTVIKRDGTPAHFRIEKIFNVLDKAFATVEMETPVEVYDFIKDWVNTYEEEVIDVEKIQDKIEKYLMRYYPCVAKNFIIYRAQHKQMREEKDSLIKEVDKKLKAKNVENQNANVDEYSFGGRMGEVTRVVTKDYALKYCMSKKSKNNHLNNEIYIHDLDSYAAGMHNCLSIPFDELLAKGFHTRQTDVRPANSINTAMQLVAVIFQLQSLQQFGGVSATHLDWTMVPYVKKSFRKHVKGWFRFVENYKKEEAEKVVCELEDNWGELCFGNEGFKNNYPKIYNYAYGQTEVETYQAVEGMYHNLNTLQSRSGNQLPFTSINYGTCTSPEGRMVTQKLLEVSIAGLGKFHKTPIFPCGIFQYMKGVNDKPGTPNYDLYQLALQSTARRLYPNYANVDWSGNAGEEKVIDIKNQFIDSLSNSDRKKLVEAIKKDPSIGEKLGITIINE